MRTIENVLDPLWSGVVNGDAEFSPQPGNSNELLYEERGVFTTTAGKHHRVTKSYIFAYNPETDNVEKYFAENETRAGLFYVFGDEVHKCAKDCYKPSHSFPPHENFDSFSLSYNATGPNKNYTIRTTYSR